MAKLLEISEHINQLKDHSIEQIELESKNIETTLLKGEAWLSTNAEHHPQYDQCFLKYRNLLRRKAAVHIRECEPREQQLFE